MPEQVIEVLSSIDELEWYECSPIGESESSKIYAPYIVWRFKTKNFVRDEAIFNAVNTCCGQTEWVIKCGIRNWYITIKPLINFFEKSEYNQFPKARQEFSKLYPEVGQLANHECHMLVKKLKEIKGGLI